MHFQTASVWASRSATSDQARQDLLVSPRAWDLVLVSLAPFLGLVACAIGDASRARSHVS